LLEPVTGGQVRLVKRAEVEGGAGPLLRLFAPKMRRDTAESLAALQKLLARLAKVPSRYELEGTSPGLAAPRRPVAWLTDAADHPPGPRIRVRRRFPCPFRVPGIAPDDARFLRLNAFLLPS